MKDGTTYYLLRANYTTSDKNNIDISNLAPNFFIQLMNYKPKTDKATYTIDTLPKNLSEKIFLHVVSGDVYVGFEIGDLTDHEIMLVLHSIK